MAIVSNMKSLLPARQAFKQEITLLSRGYVNPVAFPDGKITIYPWDSETDEWVSDRVRKPKRNRMLWELCARLCNLNNCPIEDFVVGDVNTVLLLARSIQHKNVIRYFPLCPACGSENKPESVQVPNELEKIGEKTADYPGYDVVQLPNCGDTVKIRPLQVKDEIMIDEREAATKQLISDNLAHILVPILTVGNGKEEGKPDSIQELLTWWIALHPMDKKFLEEAENRLYPHLSLLIPHTCDACNHKFNHSLSLDQDFFRGG